MTDELQLLFIASQYRLGSDNTAMLHELVLKEIDWLMMLPEDLTKRFTEDPIAYILPGHHKIKLDSKEIFVRTIRTVFTGHGAM